MIKRHTANFFASASELSTIHTAGAVAVSAKEVNQNEYCIIIGVLHVRINCYRVRVCPIRWQMTQKRKNCTPRSRFLTYMFAMGVYLPILINPSGAAKLYTNTRWQLRTSCDKFANWATRIVAWAFIYAGYGQCQTTRSSQWGAGVPRSCTAGGEVKNVQARGRYF